jgi:hypothetical protein
LNTLESWVHHHPNILKANRILHFIPDSVPEDEREEFEGKLTENDAVLGRLAAASEDAPLIPPAEGEETGGLGAWTQRIVGD